MTDAERIAAATRTSDAARERLVDSIRALAQQLEPKRLAKELWEDAKDKGADLAEEAVDAVKARPLAVGGVAAAIALFLAREPIADFAGKMLKSNGSKRAAAKSRKPAALKRAPARKPAAPAARTKAMEKDQ